MPDVKSTELARRLGVSDSAIRDWANRYEEFLSPTGRGVVEGASRIFTYEDQVVLATVAHLRAQGVPHDSIESQLREGWRVEAPPPSSKEEEDAPQYDRGLVPVGQLNRALDEIQRLAIQLDETKAKLEEERAKREEEREQATQRIIELERKAARLDGEIAQMKIRLEEEKARKRGLFGR